MLDERQRREALGVGLLALGLLVGLSLLSPALSGGGNWIGPAGDVLYEVGRSIFGVLALLAAPPLLVWGLERLGLLPTALALRATLLLVGVLVLVPAVGWLMAAIPSGAAGGAVDSVRGWPGAGGIGRALGSALDAGFGRIGGLLIATSLLLVLVVLTSG
ncbi:MAG: hypothetical protein ACRELC_03735, partial [Gemmatimonadota bacterium]